MSLHSALKEPRIDFVLAGAARDYADVAREWFHALQDSIVEKNWKTEEART